MATFLSPKMFSLILKVESSDLLLNDLSIFITSGYGNIGRDFQNVYVDIGRVRQNVHVGLPIGRGGVKKLKNLVYVDCERPLMSIVKPLWEQQGSPNSGQCSITNYHSLKCHPV